MSLEDGTDSLSLNVGKYQSRLCNIPGARIPKRSFSEGGCGLYAALPSWLGSGQDRDVSSLECHDPLWVHPPSFPMGTGE
jgi:hypothetical protein